MNSRRQQGGRSPAVKRRRALLLTHSGDFYTIDRVARAVRRLGFEAIRFDTDTFPTRASLAIERTRAGLEAVLQLEDRSIRLSEVHAVWLRRLWAPAFPDALNELDRQACAAQAQVMVTDTLAHLTDTHWVNPLEASTRAESKVLQLKLAHRLGFELPDTTITNDAAWVERLRGRQGALITKLLTPLSASMEGSARFFYTARVPDELVGLSLAPQIFQPLIEKAHELRVIVVGQEFFTASIDASGSAHARVDWRRLQKADGARWKKATLPNALMKKILRLMRGLGLVSGALDFIVTKQGRHVFLEVNPAGEWGWLERDLGFDISGAFARALTSGTAA